MKKEKQTADKKRKKKGIRKFLVPIIVLLIVLALLIIRMVFQSGGEEGSGGPGARGGSGGTQQVSEEDKVFTINTTTAVEGPITDYLDINGEVVSTVTVETYPETNGVLSRVLVDIGDFVRSNEVVAQVDPSVPGLTYSLNPVRARISGTITAVYLDPGDVVTPQRSIMRIGDLNNLEVQASIPERFISRVRVGMNTELRMEAFPGEIFDATVTQVSPVVDPVTRSVGISIGIPTQFSDVIKAGMFVKVRLVTDQKESVVKLPADTILRRDGATYVYVVNGDSAERRDILTGVILEDTAEIVEGIEAGEEVVYQGQTLLDDGVKVRVVRTLKVIDS